MEKFSQFLLELMNWYSIFKGCSENTEFNVGTVWKMMTYPVNDDVMSVSVGLTPSLQ